MGLGVYVTLRYVTHLLTYLLTYLDYDYPDHGELEVAFRTMAGTLQSPDAIRHFILVLETRFIPVTFHVNSYLQALLVDLHKTAEELLRLAEQGTSTLTPAAEASHNAKLLFERMAIFESRLETSLQRGSIKYGYYKQRKWKHTDVAAFFTYLWSKLWWTDKKSTQASTSTLKPVAIEAREIAAQMRALHGDVPAPALRCETLDMESLYFASYESNVTSAIILSAQWTFFTFFVFVFGQICVAAIGGDVRTICTGAEREPNWAEYISIAAGISSAVNQPITALLSTWQLSRKLLLAVGCRNAVGVKANKAIDEVSKHTLRQITYIATTVGFIQVVRILSSIAAAVSIPWNLARGAVFTCDIDFDPMLPVWVAAGAFGAHLLALALRFIVEYSVLWTVDPIFAKHVSEAFADDLQALKAELTNPIYSTEVTTQHERKAWFYVARALNRRYRFDTVFGVNRFGNIFHRVQTMADNEESNRQNIRYTGLQEETTLAALTPKKSLRGTKASRLAFRNIVFGRKRTANRNSSPIPFQVDLAQASQTASQDEEDAAAEPAGITDASEGANGANGGEMSTMTGRPAQYSAAPELSSVSDNPEELTPSTAAILELSFQDEPEMELPTNQPNELADFHDTRWAFKQPTGSL